MSNDGRKPDGGVPGRGGPGRADGLIPASFRSLSRMVLSGASTVASTVQSASAASAIVERDSDASHHQVMKLKEQLSEAEKEIQRLLERCDGVSSNNPASLFSMEAMDPPPFLGEFGMEGFGNIFYVPENNYNHGMDWVNLI